MKVQLIHLTPEAEKHVAYCARVSSKQQDNPEFEKLLSYCIKHQHWSVFEMASMCLEITTSRAIAAQILRHKSFSFQEHSQRYAEAATREIMEARLQDTKNRQNSFKDEKDFLVVYADNLTNINYQKLFDFHQTNHSVATIAPFALLIPIVGLVSSILILNETLEVWKIIAGGLVVSGLCVNLLGPIFYKKLKSLFTASISAVS